MPVYSYTAVLKFISLCLKTSLYYLKIDFLKELYRLRKSFKADYKFSISLLIWNNFSCYFMNSDSFKGHFPRVLFCFCVCGFPQ